ncbi:hypothetical protein Sjap_006113 [Stephania japonica]|uniref:Uncharacterized protein n=1 Tax=Stephania japonica TaxID=461633 RepID=A0AAP0K6F2_9MAGN
MWSYARAFLAGFEIHRQVGARRRCLAISSEARSEPLALLSLCRYFVFCCIFWLCIHLF